MSDCGFDAVSGVQRIKTVCGRRRIQCPCIVHHRWTVGGFKMSMKDAQKRGANAWPVCFRWPEDSSNGQIDVINKKRHYSDSDQLDRV